MLKIEDFAQKCPLTETEFRIQAGRQEKFQVNGIHPHPEGFLPDIEKLKT